MNSLDLINKLYKPYRITKINKCTIIDTTEGKFAIKPKGNKNISELYNYLVSRDFDNFPKMVDESRSDINIFEYVEDIKYPKEQKALVMVKLVSKLHYSTVYTKEVREDKFKEIYENILNNLEYYRQEYEEIIKSIETEIFMSPSHYLFIRNSSKIMNMLKFCENKLNDWYEEVKEKRDTRVSVVHNNLSLDHYIKGDKECLISWDKSITDSPVLDIYNWYKEESLDVEFGSVLKKYLRNFPLEKSEQDLLLIMLCMPKPFEWEKDKFKPCEKISNALDYVFRTEELVRPYYSVDNKE